MLVELRVRDLATIADVTLQLGPGLNVLTGETGAGKSMLVDALALLLGERADPGAVRPGASQAIVEGVFEVEGSALRRRVEEFGLDLDAGRLVLRRAVPVDGRSRAWANGSPTTAGVLAELGALLVDLHGQHETQSLLGADAQRDILDAFAQADGARRAVAEAHAAVQALRAEERTLADRRDEARRRADYLRHVVQEIGAAKPKPGEDERLAAEARRLGQATTLAEQARRIATLLEAERGALPALAQAERAIQQLAKLDPDVAAWRELADAAYAQLAELARTAGAYADGIEDDPARLAEVERRRDVLDALLRKYGPALADVEATRASAVAELDLLDTADTDLRALATRRTAAEEALVAACAALGTLRREAGERLARAVNRLLPGLGLAGGRLGVELPPATEPGPRGAETVAFVVQLNAGLEPRPLAKVASGGELSRLMLALKVVLARHDRIGTLVFDEVDAGVGGEIGARLGEALAEVAAKRQVFAITHLPQIAAKADRHLVVAKRAKGGVATSDVTVVHGEDRVGELARMLGDAEGAAARTLAQELLR
ncbi:MAG: DNA repair protein RecN [Gemmatimonadales bacterium]|nr:DNA repair protein RecN [Gemmatimonadales bacterium]